MHLPSLLLHLSELCYEVCNNPVAMARAAGPPPITGPTIKDYLGRDRPSLWASPCRIICDGSYYQYLQGRSSWAYSISAPQERIWCSCSLWKTTQWCTTALALLCAMSVISLSPHARTTDKSWKKEGQNFWELHPHEVEAKTRRKGRKARWCTFCAALSQFNFITFAEI